MATGMWIVLNGVDEKLYERLNDEMNVYNDPPKGLLFHSAGPAQNGWGVFDIWDSKEHFEQFRATRLQSAFAKLGIPRPSKDAEFFPIHNTFAPQPNLIARLSPAGARR